MNQYLRGDQSKVHETKGVMLKQLKVSQLHLMKTTLEHFVSNQAHHQTLLQNFEALWIKFSKSMINSRCIIIFNEFIYENLLPYQFTLTRRNEFCNLVQHWWRRSSSRAIFCISVYIVVFWIAITVWRKCHISYYSHTVIKPCLTRLSINEL